MPSTIEASKKRKRESIPERPPPDAQRIRSQLTDYNPYTDCLYCTDPIPYFMNCSKEPPLNYDKKHKKEHIVQKIDIETIMNKAANRGDQHGDQLKYRLRPFIEHGDLVAIEAKYHHDCQVRYN